MLLLSILQAWGEMINRIKRKYLGNIVFAALLGFALWTVLEKFISNDTNLKSSTSPVMLKTLCSSEKMATEDRSLNWFDVEASMLVICVFSRPESVDLRNSCRNTWMKKFRHNKHILFKFMVGTGGLESKTLTTLHLESQTYGDLALLDGHKEEYGPQCTEKLMLTFQWVSSHTNATFVMKTDDDCYVRLQCLISLIKQADSYKPFLLGTIAENEPPRIDGKWKETE